MAKDFNHCFSNIIFCFTVKDFIQHARAAANMYTCLRVVIYACLCANTYVCAYGYSFGDIDMCIYMFVSVIACLPFYLPFWRFLGISLCHLHYSLCYYIVIYLMLYICDRSTPDLNKDDELNWTEYLFQIEWCPWPVWVNACRRRDNLPILTQITQQTHLLAQNLMIRYTIFEQ